MNCNIKDDTNFFGWRNNLILNTHIENNMEVANGFEPFPALSMYGNFNSQKLPFRCLCFGCLHFILNFEKSNTLKVQLILNKNCRKKVISTG
jgi:hypothetical protein